MSHTDTSGDHTIHFSVADELQPLMRLILGDLELQKQLHDVYDPKPFADILCRIADQSGVACPRGALDGATRPDPLGIGRWQPAPITMAGWPELGWLPARSVPNAESGEPAFDWAHFGPAALRAPFFEDSVRSAGSLPFNRLFRTRTTLDALIDGADSCSEETLLPSGFIFHMSRCGSTLLGNMFASVDHHCVISEPEPLDAVVQWAMLSSAPKARKIAALRAMVAALGRRRSPQLQRYFIKTDAWHTVALPLFREAFPDVPWIFLHRDPVEVLVSQMTMPGIHVVPGVLPDAILKVDGGMGMSPVQYCAAVLNRIVAAVVANWPLGGGMIVNYRDLPLAGLSRIPDHFGSALDDFEISNFSAAAGYNSKSPEQRFQPDTQRKQEAASPEILDAAASQLRNICQQLEYLGSNP